MIEHLHVFFFVKLGAQPSQSLESCIAKPYPSPDTEWMILHAFVGIEKRLEGIHQDIKKSSSLGDKNGVDLLFFFFI